ncbi:MAG: hypothetical protein CMF72_24655 [Mameliella sp.]|nr:hypothetical protein [Mameliella sp.]|tara:strand:- start:181 stop:420 length:240 start_codon:yes stop_codon:yes gene_type:complete
MNVTSPTPDVSDVADRVNAAIRVGMARANITQGEMARRLDMTYQAYWRRMSGSVSWDVNELAQVAAVLGVDVVDLFATP